MFKIENVSKVFSNGSVEVKALNSISLFIEKQQTLAIVGPSGSGKTTLLNVLSTIEKINSLKSFEGLESAVPDWNALGTSEPKEMILITQSLKELQQIMSDYVGIVRNDVRLDRAMKRLDLLFTETEALYKSTKVSPQLCELRNLISVGYLIVKSAEFRKESRGLHYNTDHPGRSRLLQNIIL